MRLSNPNQGKPFDRTTENYGYRNEGTPDEEIVQLASNHSNHTYWQPEPVMNPEGCEHSFLLVDIGQREVECSKCHFGTTFHAGINYQEVDGQPQIILKGDTYKITTPQGQ